MPAAGKMAARTLTAQPSFVLGPQACRRTSVPVVCLPSPWKGKAQSSTVKKTSAKATQNRTTDSKTLWPALQDNSVLVSLASVVIGVSTILLKAAGTEVALEGRLSRIEDGQKSLVAGQKELLQRLDGLNQQIFSVWLNVVPKPAPPVK